MPLRRPDIVNRVFNEVINNLMEDLKCGCFGPLKARLHTVEGQFRCLKHAHILLLLANKLTVDDMDYIIQAQLPDKDIDPDLYDAVGNFMLHGPCGTANPYAPCMVNGVCTKGFPKPFQEETFIQNDGGG